MNIEKIQINGHYVWVDKSAEIKPYCIVLEKPIVGNEYLFEIHTLNDIDVENQKLVIAASPELNLEGVPTYVEWLAEQESIRNEWNSEKSFIKGYQTKEKELQKQLITEIMNEDAKDGLYEPQPTWDDVRKAIDLAREQYPVPYTNGDYEFEYSEEEIIEQLKQSKQ